MTIKTDKYIAPAIETVAGDSCRELCVGSANPLIEDMTETETTEWTFDD